MKSKKLPNGWKVVTLDSIYELKQGKHLSLNELSQNGYAVYGANGKVGYYNSYMYEQSILLITCRGASCGSINITEPKSWVTGNSIALIPKEEVDIDFMKYLLSNTSFNDVISGSAQPQIVVTTLKKKNVIIPTLETQKKIVEVLAKAEGSIEKRRETINLLDELIKAKFIEMFGNKSKYKYVKIEDLVSNKNDIVDGPFGSNLKTSDYVNNGVRVIQINNIGENEFRDNNRKFITVKKYQSLLKHSVVPGDIVVAKMGEPIGRACIIPDYIDKAVIVADCMKIRPNLSVVNRKYLEFLLNTNEVKTQFKKYSQGSTRIRLNLSMLRQIKVLYPPLQLQNQFADFVNQVEKIKTKMQKSLEELETNYKSLMQKAFKGELFN